MLAMMRAWRLPVLLSLFCSSGAHAFELDAFEWLVHQQRYGDASRAIDARLARAATDPAALAASAQLQLARDGSRGLLRARAVAERCVQANPGSSRCAEALGNVLQAQARDGGVFVAVRTAHATRDTFERAIRFNPMNYRARLALMHFYLATPFFLGGSEVRARELATEVRLTQPDLTRLMRALCALDEGKPDDAEQHILAADLSDYALVQDSQRDLLRKLAYAHFDAGRLARSKRLFDALRWRVPASETGHFGLGLVARAEGRLADAVAHLDQAAAIGPQPYVFKLLGEVHEARHDRARAIVAYHAALAGVPPLARREQEWVTAHLVQLQRR